MGKNADRTKFLTGFLVLFLASYIPLLSSCSLRKPATAVTADIATRGMAAVESEEDLYIAKESSLPLIKVVEVLSMGDPNNRKFQGLLAKVYGNYAFGIGEIEMMKSGYSPEWAERVKRFYFKGKESGIRSLSSGKKNVATMPMPEFQGYLKKFNKKNISDLFWTAFDWGSYINMKRDDIIEAANLPRVEIMVDRVAEIDPEFSCGAANAFKGAIIAGNPLRSGGKPETAKPYFEKAMASCGGNYLMNKVMYAEWYLKSINDMASFKTALNEVLEADASILPSQRLANELAKERARILIGQQSSKSARPAK